MLLPGTLDVLVLKAVSLGHLHGYGVLLRIEQITKGALVVEQGALYPALYRLEQQGFAGDGMGRVGQQPPGQVLPADAGGPPPAAGAAGELAAAGRCDGGGARHAAGGGVTTCGLACVSGSLRCSGARGSSAIWPTSWRSMSRRAPRSGERRGLPPSAARRRALIEFGSAERIKEEVRDVRLGRWLEVLRQDLHYGFRVLRAHPVITAIGVASLALGMAVCIYSFSRVHADFLAPLPGARDPGSLVAVDARLSYPAFERIRELDGVLEGATGYLGPVPFSVAVDGEQGAERVFGHLVSPEYFEALGVAPAAGRLLSPGTERAGSGTGQSSSANGSGGVDWMPIPAPWGACCR